MDTSGKTNPAQLAVVGMDIRLGGVNGLDDLLETLFKGLQQTHFPGDMHFNLEAHETARFVLTGSPTTNLDEETRLLLKCAAGALDDAGINPQSGRGAFLFSSMQRHLSETPSEPAFRYPGLQVDLSGDGHPLATILLEAQRLLCGRTVDYVLAGAACLSRDCLETLQNAVRKQNSGPLTLGFDQTVDGWSIGEGAAALVLVRREETLAEGRRCYALLNAFARAQRDGPPLKKNLAPTFVSADTIQAACRLAFEQNSQEPFEIGSLEALGSGYPPLDAAEIGGLTRFYQGPDSRLTCALGSLATHSGYLFNAAGLAALVKSALCLHHRILPATPAWSGPKKIEAWENTPFYVTPEARTWILPAGTSQRHAALNSIGWDGSSLHLILSENSAAGEGSNALLKQSDFFLFPMAASNQDDLGAQLRQLTARLQGGEPLGQLAKAQYQDYLTHSSAPYALCITGPNRNDLQREVDLALKSLPAAFEQKKAWQTPMGSCFTPEPLGAAGEVAFVYPGAFNSYIGMGRELFLLFPQVYDRVARLTADIGATLQDEQLYPRTLQALDAERLAQLENRLTGDPIAMITSGSLMAVLFTLILRDVFKVKPSAALGYSLGEITMLFGTGAWTEADATRKRLQNSPLFQSRLAGAQNAVRSAWGLPPLTMRPEGERLWSNYFVMSPVDKVADALRDETRVYLTHINTPRQVVIGGEAGACQRVLDRVKGMSLKAPFDFALHNRAMQSEHDSLAELLTWPVSAPPGLRLYSAAGAQPLVMDSQAIAGKMADMLCNCIHFPNLVQQVYDSGARVFIELGANANCSRWIDDSLKGSPNLAVSINRRGSPDHESIVRLLARLVSQRVPLDLSPLYA